MLEAVNSALSGIAVPLLLFAVGAFYCVRLKCFHVLKPLAVIRGVRSGQGASAVLLALAGTLGVGNVVGVASAIYMGGFGAVFWLWVSAFVAMILKYAEITLAMRYRERGIGGAVDYIGVFIRRIASARIAKAVCGVFAGLFLLNAFTMGGMLQANATAEALSGVEGIPPLLVGATLATVCFFVIRRGATGIMSFTNILVPLMSVGYVVASLTVIIKDASRLPEAIRLIFSSAFNAKSALGGVGGFAFMRAVRYGVMRGLVSNEAGCGTAPTAHALAKNSPAGQGTWGIFEVFVDTVLLCSLTAFVIILEYDGAKAFAGNYMMMTVGAFRGGLGAFAPHFICIAVTCFALATVVCWAHYGLSCVRFFSQGKGAKRAFTLAYCGSVLMGAVVSSELAWQLSDLCMALMTLINLAVLVGMSSEVKWETECYFEASRSPSTVTVGSPFFGKSRTAGLSPRRKT